MAADFMAEVQPLIPALRRYARAMLRDSDSADDLVQDCLERVITHWDERRRAEDTRQWVFAIAHNLGVNKVRQEMRAEGMDDVPGSDRTDARITE